MKIQETTLLLNKAIKNNLKILLVGIPGIGKTAIIRQIAQSLNMKVITFIGSMKDPTDINGMPLR